MPSSRLPDLPNNAPADGPLAGLLVVSIEQAVAAPLASARLAAAGARVIKIERSEGDFARGYDSAASGDSSYFTWLNQGKESAVIDFKDAGGKALLWAMLARADVLIQNLSPGALARSGFDNAALQAHNPRLIICNISGYGDSGPASKKPAYDLLVQAESGLISVSGSPDALGRIGVSICDIGTGVTAHAGILEALIKRGITKRGSQLSVSLFDVSAEWMMVPYIHAHYGKGAPAPVGLRHPSIAPYGAFECGDGRFVLISIQNEREWQRLCVDALDAPWMAANEAYMSNNARVANRDALEAHITKITKGMSAGEFSERLTAARIAFGMVNGAADLQSHPAMRAATYGNSAADSLALPAHPILWDDAEPMPATKTPKIGEHTDAIIAEFSPAGGDR
ncbi:CoA transferase [Alphaproteobacteria bacterium]|nr:CoA transferase [Alphaproteobacteria bacterium]